MLTIGEGGPLQAPFGLVIGQGGPDGELRSKRIGDGGHHTLDSSWWLVGGHRNMWGGCFQNDPTISTCCGNEKKEAT